MGRYGCFFATLCFVAICFTGPFVTLAVMEPLSTEELVNNSTCIVIGKVADKYSAWSADGRKIVTRYRVEVDETVAGTDPGKIVEVEHDGGIVGETGLDVSDVPAMDTNATVLLFLQAPRHSRTLIRPAQASPGAFFAVTGHAQGRYTIAADGIARKDGFTVLASGARIDAELSLMGLRTLIKRLWSGRNTPGDILKTP